MVDVQALGRRLKQLRELKGKSLSRLAQDAQVSKSYLAKLERGEIENPGLKTLHAIAGALEITLNELLKPSTNQAPPSPSAAASEVAEYEQVLAELPPGLRTFLDEKEAAGDRVPADMVRLLAGIEFRGNKPETSEDWRFVYNAIRRSM